MGLGILEEYQMCSFTIMPNVHINLTLAETIYYFMTSNANLTKYIRKHKK